MMQTAQLATLIDAHIGAYQAKNLEAFVACFTEDVRVWNFSQPDAAWSGHTELRTRYGQFFSAADTLRVTIHQRIIEAPFVIDHEEAHGIPAYPHGLRIGVIYTCTSDGISDMCFLR